MSDIGHLLIVELTSSNMENELLGLLHVVEHCSFIALELEVLLQVNQVNEAVVHHQEHARLRQPVQQASTRIAYLTATLTDICPCDRQCRQHVIHVELFKQEMPSDNTPYLVTDLAICQRWSIDLRKINLYLNGKMINCN